MGLYLLRFVLLAGFIQMLWFVTWRVGPEINLVNYLLLAVALSEINRQVPAEPYQQRNLQNGYYIDGNRILGRRPTALPETKYTEAIQKLREETPNVNDREKN